MENKTKGAIIIEGHVQGLANTRILGKAGIPVIVISKNNCIARYSRYCQKFFLCPDYLSDGFIEFLIKLAIAENLYDWVLLPSNDHAVYIIAKNKKELSEYYRVITENFDVISKIYNKRALLGIALKAKISIPASVMPESESTSLPVLNYPILIKGNNGLNFYKIFKRKVFLARSEMELKKLITLINNKIRPSDYFFQELIPAGTNTISVAVFSVNGEIYTYWMGEKIREHPIRFGTATCCKSTYENEVIRLSKIIISELKYTGVCEIEWLKDRRDNEYKLIEINARSWLWVGLADKCGISFPIILLKYIYNKEIPKQLDYRIGFYWINIYTDAVYTVKRIFLGIDKVKTILSSYQRFTEACWDPQDPIPFFMYGLLSIGFLCER